MAGEQKTKAKVEQAKGRIKAAFGRASDDPGLVAEGRTKKSKGDMRQAKEKIKDAFRR